MKELAEYMRETGKVPLPSPSSPFPLFSSPAPSLSLSACILVSLSPSSLRESIRLLSSPLLSSSSLSGPIPRHLLLHVVSVER